MDKKKYLQQAYSKIKEKGISQAEIKEDCINIIADDVVIFKIDMIWWIYRWGSGVAFCFTNANYRIIIQQ